MTASPADTAALSATLPPPLAAQAELVENLIRAAADGATRQGRLGVAFSGGVDSSLLLALAVRALGPARVVAVLGVSPSLAAAERRGAHDVAAHVGAPLVEVATHEGDNPAYRANGPDRCFHCKDELFTRITDEVAGTHRLSTVAYGENADDARRPDRPGSRAATNHGVIRPLADAGLTKSDVRALARALGLPSADKPAAPCLASRIPHFSTVDPEKLGQVEQLEGRCGTSASPTTGCATTTRSPGSSCSTRRSRGRWSPDMRLALQSAGVAAGFTFVAVDVAGIQSGAFTLPLVSLSHD